VQALRAPFLFSGHSNRCQGFSAPLPSGDAVGEGSPLAHRYFQPRLLESLPATTATRDSDNRVFKGGPSNAEAEAFLPLLSVPP